MRGYNYQLHDESVACKKRGYHAKKDFNYMPFSSIDFLYAECQFYG